MVEPRSVLESLLELYVEGSGDWILANPTMQQWLNYDGPGPIILHITGHPGSGKSVMASFLVRHLEDEDKNVQFFFFRFDSQQSEKSIRHCLLCLAYQLAMSNPEYGRRLKAMLEDKRSFSNTDVRRLWQRAFIGILSKLDNIEPIYWVIDAVDEADSVHLLLNLLPLLQTAEIPVRILFLTRPHTVGRAFDKLSLSLAPRTISNLSMSTPQTALSLYISQELQFTKWPGDPEFMEHITKSLLKKCRGNFLWLRLVLKELANCNFQHEALSALEEIPPELASVYSRIQSQLVKDMRPENQMLAVRILSWIACSERQLTLEELADGLKSHRYTDPMLHPQQTIDRLCGDLVVVDKNHNVSLVHHTAKEFLTQAPSVPFYIDTPRAHSLILERCLEELMDPKFRLKIKTDGCRGFLQYACSSWSYHLALCSEHDDSILHSIGLLLQNSAALSWIDAASQMGQLRILTTASKNISTFRDRRRKLYANQMPIAQSESDMELLGQWSSDLVRIVGKFGHQLIRHPTSIYTLIPALCPLESAIHSQFFSTANSSMVVSGLKNKGWDDSVARFSTGHDSQPTAISAFEDHFAIHSSDDTVALYSSSVFQILREFCHEEVIVALNYSQDGTRLVTCGSRTIKIWDVPTGRLLDYYPNPGNTRAVAVAINSESKKLHMCCTDGQIVSQDLGSPEGRQIIPREVSVDGSLGSASGTPCAAAFSPDATKLAMAFRGRSLGLWAAETGRLIGRCQRRTSVSTNQLQPYPQRLTWNPIHEHVLGIYNDGTLFKWNPVDMYAEELDHPIMAHEVACSPDGRFIVTASSGGSLHVWHYDSMKLIYHLSCTSPVIAMSVSADARRIYDLRESFCNVWEPNSLLRLAESEEKGSETSSQHAESIHTSLVSDFTAAIADPVTAIAVGISSPAHCYANDNGELTLQLTRDSIPVTVDSGYIGATYLAFNNDDSMIACAELEGSITIRRITADEEPLSDLVQLSPGSLVQHLLFTRSNSTLVVKCLDELSLWDVEAGTKLAKQRMEDEEYRPVLHPRNGDQLLTISTSGCKILSSKDLSLIGTLEVYGQKSVQKPPNVAPSLSTMPFSKHHTGRSTARSIISNVLVSPGQSRILVEMISEKDPGEGCDIDFFFVDTNGITRPDLGASLKAEPLPTAILQIIEIPLGFIVSDVASRGKSVDRWSLAFLDRDFWVCTWALSDERGDRWKRHFFLPDDWINLDCLRMATVTTDGRFLCPRNGELVVIVGGFNDPWLE